MKVYLHMPNGNVQQNLLCAAFCHEESSHLAPVLANDFSSRCKFNTGTPTINRTILYSSIIGLYPQNSVFEVVHDDSVRVHLHKYNGNVQQNPLCVEPCLKNYFSMSPRFSSTIFDPDANPRLLRAHLCTAVDSSIVGLYGVHKSILYYLGAVTYNVKHSEVHMRLLVQQYHIFYDNPVDVYKL